MATVYAVGIGPGGRQYMTEEAAEALRRADVLCGYPVYLDLVTPCFPGKELLSTPMKKETERCRMALEAAQEGKTVAMVCSGDAGVYGMAGLVLELVLQQPEDKRPEFGGVIAGVSAVNAAASVLGAPLMHDFAVISLSDLLTPWETIEKRIEMAAQGDFVTALYNPKSKKRVENIERVREIMLQHRKADTPVGIVTAASREGEGKIISTLEDFTKQEINMFSLVIIGNSMTYVKDGYMITPRGYGNKEPGL